MTSVVKQTLALLTANLGTDRQASRNRPAEEGFGEALRSAKSGRHQAERKQDADGKSAGASQHWMGLGSRFAAAIDRTKSLDSAKEPPVLELEGDEQSANEPQAVEQEPALETAEPTAEPVPIGIVAALPLRVAPNSLGVPTEGNESAPMDAASAELAPEKGNVDEASLRPALDKDHPQGREAKGPPTDASVHPRGRESTVKPAGSDATAQPRSIKTDAAIQPLATAAPPTGASILPPATQKRQAGAGENRPTRPIAETKADAVRAAENSDTADAAQRPQRAGRQPAPTSPPVVASGQRDNPTASATTDPSQPVSVVAGPKLATSRSDPPATEPKSPDAPKTTAPRATILAEQNFPAPISTTAIALADKIASHGTFQAMTDPQAVTVQPAPQGVTSAHALKLQLHPAELGMVTASLRFVGNQLSIELQVENNEAYHRLSADSDAIIKSLRGLGYDIDRVTVLQPQIAMHAPARADANAPLQGQSPRGQDAFGSGAAGGGSGSDGRRSEGERSDARHDGQRPGANPREVAGRGLYI